MQVRDNFRHHTPIFLWAQQGPACCKYGQAFIAYWKYLGGGDGMGGDYKNV